MRRPDGSITPTTMPTPCSCASMRSTRILRISASLAIGGGAAATCAAASIATKRGGSARLVMPALLLRFSHLVHHQNLPDHFGARAGVALLLLEELHEPVMAAATLVLGQARRQPGALLQRLHRRPERLLQHVVLRVEHRLGREGMADAAAVADVVVSLLDLPQ